MLASVHAAVPDCLRQGGLFISHISGDEKSRIKALPDWESGEGACFLAHRRPPSPWVLIIVERVRGLSRVTQSIHEDPPP